MNKLPFFDAVLFDMDGTLVDSEPIWLESEIELMDRFGYLWTSKDQAFCLGGPLNRVGDYMNQLAGNTKDADYFVTELVNLMVAKMEAGAGLMNGALEILSFVRDQGAKTALVSASPRKLMDAVLKSITPVSFELTISSDDVQYPKPSPESYIKAAHYLGVHPKNCLVLEDSLTGVQSAVESGAYVIALPHLVAIKESERVKVFDSLSDLTPEVLLSLRTHW
ncbi:MAG: HAD-IA family hydrolase [Actinobacteria bacterium]|nr:HAD-IA family hydrolase [Actinomycetota bacterium]MSW23036.1 HAD-IA family hydrolase [Actinomycetota bacterium]MSW75271.1 HAD-IA family hydrolase [Actinomycetota bacterium]MSY30816.1 HAD-IA family hydrolase [Actinomycetota bacterium]